MEADWDRNEAPIPLDLAGANDLLAPLGLSAIGLSLMPEGKVNSNYRVETLRGPVLLRLHHGADHVVDIKAALATRLHGSLSVPALLGRGPRFLVYEWCRGMTLDRALATNAPLPCARIGAALAAARTTLNGLTFDQPGFLDAHLNVAEPWPSAIDGLWSYLRALVPRLQDRALAERVRQIADDAEPRLRNIAGPPVLVHGDFKPTNLLVDEDGLVALIDWEFAHSGTWMTDAGQILRYPETLPPDLMRAFTEGLGLDEERVLLVRTLDLVNLVDSAANAGNNVRRREGMHRQIAKVCDEYESCFGPLP